MQAREPGEAGPEVGAKKSEGLEGFHPSEISERPSLFERLLTREEEEGRKKKKDREEEEEE